MNDYDEVVSNLRHIISGVRYVNFRQATTGKLNSDGTLNPNATEGLPDGYIWVRFGEDRSAAVVKNMTMRNVAGVHVEVVYDSYHQEDQVWEVDRVRALVALGSATAAAMNVPEQGAGISTPVSARDVVPGGVFADVDGGLNVRLAPTWTPFGAWWDGTTLIALTPTATANSKSFVVIGIQDNGTVTTALTADRGLAAPLVTSDGLPTAGGAADIQAVTEFDPAVWWVGAVELANGDTSVNPAKIVDRRFWNLPGNAGDGGAGGAAPQAYIVGLEVDCASTTQITIQPGLCRDDADGYTMIRATADGVLTVDTTSSGANGLDTGSESSNTWYYVWLIAKSSDGTLAGLLSISSSAPTLPSGYDKQRLIGAVRNNASSNLLRGSTQRGGGNLRYWVYHESTIAAPFRVLAAANLSTTTWTDVNTSAVVPPLSRRATITFFSSTPSSSAALAWREKGVTTHEIALVSANSSDESFNTLDVPVDSSQIGQIYSYTAVAEDAYGDVIGCWLNLLPSFAGSSSTDASAYYQTALVDDAALTQRAALNFLSGAGIAVTGADDSGDDESEISFALDIDGLAGASIDGAADYLPFHDASASAPRKISINTLFASPPALGGTVAADGTFAALSTSGNAVIGAAGANTARLNVNGAASGKGVIVRGNATTPGNALEIQNSAGTVQSSLDATGKLTTEGAGTRILVRDLADAGATIIRAERGSGGSLGYVEVTGNTTPSIVLNAAGGFNAVLEFKTAGTTNMSFGRDGTNRFFVKNSSGVANFTVHLTEAAIGVGITADADQAAIMAKVPASAGGRRAIDLLSINSHTGPYLTAKTPASKIVAAIENDGAWHSYPYTALTNAIQRALVLGHNTSGTPAAGYGVSLEWQLKSGSTENVPVGREVVQWHTPTLASRSPDWVLYLSDAGGEREILRGRADGSAAALGFLGATPVTRAAHIADPTGGVVVDSEARTAINAILVILENLGFKATS